MTTYPFNDTIEGLNEDFDFIKKLPKGNEEWRSVSHFYIKEGNIPRKFKLIRHYEIPSVDITRENGNCYFDTEDLDEYVYDYEFSFVD